MEKYNLIRNKESLCYINQDLIIINEINLEKRSDNDERAIVEIASINYPYYIQANQNFQIMLTVENKGNIDLEEVTAAIEFPSEFSLISGSMKEIIGSIEPGERRSVDWVLKASKQGEFTFTIHVNSKNGGSDSITIAMHVNEYPLLLVGGGALIVATTISGLALAYRKRLKDRFLITDKVQFTVTAPKTMIPGKHYFLDVWIHLEKQRHDMIEKAKVDQFPSEIRTRSKTGVEIAQGTEIMVRLEIPTFTILDSEDTIFWSGIICNASFSVKVPEDAKIDSHLGTVEFYFKGIIIAKLHFILEVAQEESIIDQLITEERRIRSGLCSYSRDDTEKVLARVQGILKVLPNIDLFIDILSLRSGEKWQERLEEEIAKRDIFYLFWSLAASRSKWVDNEWRTALRMRGIDYIDPVPLIPPIEVPPPEELDELHFNDWTLHIKP